MKSDLDIAEDFAKTIVLAFLHSKDPDPDKLRRIAYGVLQRLRADEREACAKIAEGSGAEEIADTIRKRTT